MILALETATDICSVAFRNPDGEIFEKRSAQRGSHSENLFLFMEELTVEHGFMIQDLDAVLVSEGPGSYTGLRISASAVKGLLFQTEVSLYAMNTLAGFARAAAEADSGLKTVHSVIDARRVHLYHQKFTLNSGRLVAETDVEILPIEKVASMLGVGDAVIGTGIGRLDKGMLEKVNVYGKEHISARSLITLFEEGGSSFVNQVSPEVFDPRYYTSGQVDG